MQNETLEIIKYSHFFFYKENLYKSYLYLSCSVRIAKCPIPGHKILQQSKKNMHKVFSIVLSF